MTTKVNFCYKGFVKQSMLLDLTKKMTCSVCLNNSTTATLVWRKERLETFQRGGHVWNGNKALF